MKKTIKFLLPVAFLLPLSIMAQNASVLLQHAGKPSVFTGHDAIQDAQKAAVNGASLKAADFAAIVRAAA